MDRILEKKRWSLKRLLWMGAGGVLIASVSYGLVRSDRGSSVNLSGRRLTVTTVQQGQFQEFIPVTGALVPIRTIYLDAVEGGRGAGRCPDSRWPFAPLPQQHQLDGLGVLRRSQAT